MQPSVFASSCPGATSLDCERRECCAFQMASRVDMFFRLLHSYFPAPHLPSFKWGLSPPLKYRKEKHNLLSMLRCCVTDAYNCLAHPQLGVIACRLVPLITSCLANKSLSLLPGCLPSQLDSESGEFHHSTHTL